MRGRFVWEDLMTTDTKSAAAFYGKVAGLKTAPAPSDPSYTTLLAGDRGMGGLMPMAAEAKAMGAPASWLSYVGVDNVDDVARQAEALGGKVLKPPADIPKVGRFAVLQDPQGAVFAVFSTTMAFPAAATVPYGHMSWHELRTSDMNAAFSFYQQLFGWHVTADMNMGAAMGIYRLFAPEGSKDAFGGMYTRPPQQPGPPAWLPYIKVADAKGATATAKSLGAQILHGPADVPGGGLITMALDPQGAAFALHQSGPAAAQSRAAAAPKPRSTPKAKAGTKKKAAKKPAPKKSSRKSKAKATPKRRPKARAKAGSKK